MGRVETYFAAAARLGGISLAVLFLCGNSAPLLRRPQFISPPVGRVVIKSFDLAVDTMSPTECVSVPGRGATVLISRPLLKELSATMPKEWNSEEERLARIAGRDAKLVLESMDQRLDNLGCNRADLLDPDKRLKLAAINDPARLISRLLDSGQATVVDDSTGKPVAQIVVTFSGLGHMGYISYSLDRRADPFYSTSWYIQ